MEQKRIIGICEDAAASVMFQNMRTASKKKLSYIGIFAVKECPLPDEEIFVSKPKVQEAAGPVARMQTSRNIGKSYNAAILPNAARRQTICDGNRKESNRGVDVKSKYASTTDITSGSQEGIWDRNAKENTATRNLCVTVGEKNSFSSANQEKFGDKTTAKPREKVMIQDLSGTNTSEQDAESKPAPQSAHQYLSVHNQTRHVTPGRSFSLAVRRQTELDTARRNVRVPRYGETNKGIKRYNKMSVSCHSIQHSIKNEENKSVKKSKNDPSSEISNGTEHSLISIKVEEKECYEITTKTVDLERIKKKYPELSEVIPEIGAANKEIKWSQKAVLIVLKYLFNTHNLKSLSNGKTAVEAITAAKKWGITEFRNELQAYFLQNLLPVENIDDLYRLADHLGEHELCVAIKHHKTKLTGDSSVTKRPPRYRQKTCRVSCQRYVDSSEFTIPLIPRESHEFGEEFNRDITCQITFSAVTGSFAITGFQMSFLDNASEVKDLPKLKIHYNLKNLQNEDYSVDDQKEKPFRSKVILHLQRDFIVKKGQKCELSVDTEIKPFQCFLVDKDLLLRNTQNSEFLLKLKSTFSVKPGNKMRFFIEKLFYREVNET